MGWVTTGAMSFPSRTRTYEYLLPLTDFTRLAGLSGLEVIRRIVTRELPAPPITATLGFALVEAEHGRAVFEGEAAEWQYNPIGTVHGGWSATLLDSADRHRGRAADRCRRHALQHGHDVVPCYTTVTAAHAEMRGSRSRGAASASLCGARAVDGRCARGARV